MSRISDLTLGSIIRLRSEPLMNEEMQASRQGAVCGVLAYGCWGLIPLYFKLVANVSPGEVLAQRIVWSFLFLAILVTLLRRWRDLLRALASRRVLGMLAASTILLSLNWLVYIYAVSSNQVVEASTGYFLNPLVNVLIGVLLLKESISFWQIVSVLLAGLGVVILGVPLIAVSLALSFAFYGLLRKKVEIEGLLGLLIETGLLLLPALFYVLWLHRQGESAFVTSDPRTCLNLMASGVVTAVPLLLFTAAARRLRFSTLGFLQYIAPTMQFLLAVLLFREELSATRWLAMGFIWAAVAIYCGDSLRLLQAQRDALTEPAPADV